MALLKTIFILVLFLFPLGEVVRINLGNGVAIRPLDVGVGVLLLSWLTFKFLNKQKIKQFSLLLPILLFAASGLFSLITSNLSLSLSEFVISFSYLLRWTVYAGIFFVVSDFSKEFKRKISTLLIIIGSFVVGLGYVQYFFYPSLRNLYYLGWDEHMYRMFSVFLDPNFAGVFFVLFFLFLANLFLEKKNILIGLFIVLTLGAVFLTFSRSALIMLIISSSLLFVLMNKKIWIAVLLGVIVLVLSASSKYFSIENINLFRIVSSEARLETAKNAIRIIQNHPVFGVGFNAYKYAQLDYGFRNGKAAVMSHADAGADNSFLFVMATTGITGFILYLFLWFKIIKIASGLAIASIVGVFVNSMFINSLFYPFIMLWLWIILALSIKNHS